MRISLLLALIPLLFGCAGYRLGPTGGFAAGDCASKGIDASATAATAAITAPRDEIKCWPI